MAGTPLQIMVGLGNPGPEYRLTRHNAGFWFVDALAHRHGGSSVRTRVTRARSRKVVVERHGTGAAEAADLHEPQRPVDPRADGLHTRRPAAVLVVHDELDLPCGVARLKLGGGHGGHNGLRDIIAHCGAEFWRLRLGVGHPATSHRSSTTCCSARAAGRARTPSSTHRCRSDSLVVLLRDGAAEGDEPPRIRTRLSE